ncbi:Putative serine peptidase S28 family protein [Zea mays]|nr:Putative serine peptidase S28 family protein [Zea mays]
MVMERVVIAAVFLLLFSCQPSEAGRVVVRRPPPTLARRQRHYTSPRAGGDGGGGVSVPPAVQYETRWYTQRLDHFNSAPASYATFQQRYLVNDTFWGGPTAPIFLYAGNEGDVDLFTNNTGFMWESAPRFRALLVFVEHRYYGESMPFGGTRAAAFRDARTKGYLTVTQALADYASFVLSLKANLSAPAAPVVVFGGSYGGMLAAWMRLKYPHIVMGAVASSAPILSFYGIVDPYAFYDRITDDFKSESKHCYDVLRKSWDVLDDALATKEGQAQLRRTFTMCNGSSVQDIPSLLESAVVYAAMTDYPTPSGFLTPLPAYPVRAMCRAIDASRAESAEASSGAANDGNSNSTAQLTLSQVRDAMDVYYNHTGAAACFRAEEDDDPHGMYDGWNWQACTEVMVMAYGIRDGGVLQPSPFNFTDVVDSCRNYTGLPPRPFWIETEFGGFDIGNVLKKSASNIVFFNGLRDPWSTGGVLKSISDSIIALVEPKGSHHVDLRFSSKEDPEWLKQVRVKETRIIARWLKQYYSDEGIAA